MTSNCMNPVKGLLFCSYLPKVFLSFKGEAVSDASHEGCGPTELRGGQRTQHETGPDGRPT